MHRDMKIIRIAMGQINTTVGDIKGNCLKMVSYIRQAGEKKADILLFPELSVTGYPPEDLLLRPSFIQDNLDGLRYIIENTADTMVVAGFVDRKDDLLYNSAAVIYRGKIISTYHKIILPNYGVFDEKRYFAPGREPMVFDMGGFCFGVTICEDMWRMDGPIRQEAEMGAELVFNISASPYHCGKTDEREDLAMKHCTERGISVCYTNLVGGQDELLFDGSSFLADRSGKISARAGAFTERLLFADLPAGGKARKVKGAIPAGSPVAGDKPEMEKEKCHRPSIEEEVYTGLMTGLRDYASKNGFRKAVLGLSGGIDSALVAAIAADAMGRENVTGILMPSRYTSAESARDAGETAENLGITFMEIPIDEVFSKYLELLKPAFGERSPDTAEENLQARIRGNILMAISNKFGHLVLITGNKSEMSVGYSTLYGDMAGGFGVLKDVYKTFVYRLARYRNTVGRVMPENVLTKAPTAELRHGQKDQDTLPPYDILDEILKKYIEKDWGCMDIAESGFDEETVKKVIRMVDRSEYKRRQAPPGIKITPRALGKDRRIPITNLYRA